MPSPKERFLTLPELRTDWERITQTKAAEVARDTALLQFIADQPDASNPGASWDQHAQLVGAKRILDILYRLHLKEETRAPMKLTQLPVPK